MRGWNHDEARMVLDHQGEHGSQYAAIRSIASKIGCSGETLRNWVRQAERDGGQRAGPTFDNRRSQRSTVDQGGKSSGRCRHAQPVRRTAKPMRQGSSGRLAAVPVELGFAAARPGDELSLPVSVWLWGSVRDEPDREGYHRRKSGFMERRRCAEAVARS